MTLFQVWGALLLVTVCPIWGGLPLNRWIMQLICQRPVGAKGQGNLGLATVFNQGGTLAGGLATIATISQGLGVVFCARYFFPTDFTWVLLALVALVWGQYWLGQRITVTSLAWGCVAYDWRVALSLGLIGGISITLLREQRLGRTGVLILWPMIIALQRQRASEVMVAIALSSLIAWVYQQSPVPEESGYLASQANARLFQFFRGDRAVRSIQDRLSAQQVGTKAAALSQLNHWGYAVPMSWVLPPGDDADPLIATLNPQPEHPLVAYALRVGGPLTSSLGPDPTVPNITSRAALQAAITACRNRSALPALPFHPEGSSDIGIAVLLQVQIAGRFSGIAWSRDPTDLPRNTVIIAGYSGPTPHVHPGQIPPHHYRVNGPEAQSLTAVDQLEIEVHADPTPLPSVLIQQVVGLIREIEGRYQGGPQVMAWVEDGNTLWVLEVQPMVEPSTLNPPA